MIYFVLTSWGIISVLLGFAAVPVLAGASEIVLREDFDADPPGAVHGRLVGHSHIDLAPGAGTGGSAAIRVRYVGGEMGSERVVVRIPLEQRMDQATLSFDVRFDRDFQFVRGGKMHGLGPAHPVTGGNPVEPHRWSARLMWSRDDSLQTYLYAQQMPGRYGIVQRAEDFAFEKNRYYAVSLQVRLNDPGESNGHARVFIDGEEVIRHDGVRYRDAGGDETLIQMLLFSTFHGGNSPEWAPTDEDGEYITVYAWYDNFTVHHGRHVRTAAGATE